MHNSVSIPDATYKTFEIDPGNFRLHIGDRVFPQTILGRDSKSKLIITADCWGYIAGIGLNPFNHSLIVSITGNEELRWSNLLDYEAVFNGIRSE